MKKQIVYSSFLAKAFIFNACKKEQDVDNNVQTVVYKALCEKQLKKHILIS